MFGMADYRSSSIRLEFTGEKLSPTNYQDWCVQLKVLFRAKELWPIVNGAITCPPEPIADADGEDVAAAAIAQKRFADWSRDDAIALSLIIGSCEQAQFQYIKRCESSKDAWDTLKNLHDKPTMTRKLRAFETLFSTKFVKGTALTEHCSTLQEAAEQLKAQDAEINLPTTFLGMILFSSTRSAFPIQAAAMENIDEKELTFEYVRERLLTAEARESEDFSAIAGESGALIAASTSAPRVHDKFNTRSTTRSNNRSTAKCGYCGKNGHVERGCFKLHPELAPTWWNKPHKFNSTNICTTAKQEYACSASRQITTTSQDDAAWVIDSGATWHMARDRATFNTYTELLEDHPIRVGDGRVINAIGRGDIILKLSYRDRRTIVTLVDVLHVPALQHNLLSINLAMERLFDFRFL